MSTQNEKVTITLTDERPMRVDKKSWPLVAMATEDRDHNNQDLNRRYYLRVRLHAVETTNDALAIKYYGEENGPSLAPHEDMAAVVYGWSESNWQDESGTQSGFRCTLDTCAATIRAVGEAIGADESLVMECIGDLPPTDA
jgi:hypothetical protein